jgi:hypothetical protein
MLKYYAGCQQAGSILVKKGSGTSSRHQKLERYSLAPRNLPEQHKPGNNQTNRPDFSEEAYNFQRIPANEQNHTHQYQHASWDGRPPMPLGGKEGNKAAETG